MKCRICDGSGRVTRWEYSDNGDTCTAHSYYATCDACNGSGWVKATNADMMRQMSNDDLADVLLNVFIEGNEHRFMDDYTDVYNAIMKWLQTPAED